MSPYSYWMARPGTAVLRELDYDCPCGEGVAEIQVSEDRRVGGVPVFHCRGKNCSTDYSNGVHDEAILAAIAEAEKIEADGPTEQQLESMYDTAGPSVSDTLHRMAEARRLR